MLAEHEINNCLAILFCVRSLQYGEDVRTSIGFFVFFFFGERRFIYHSAITTDRGIRRTPFGSTA